MDIKRINKCIENIGELIADNYKNNCLDTTAVVNGLLLEYSMSEIKFAVVSHIWKRSYDGRYSVQTKKWVREQYESWSVDERVMSEECYPIFSHAGLINLLVERIMEN